MSRRTEQIRQAREAARAEPEPEKPVTQPGRDRKRAHGSTSTLENRRRQDEALRLRAEEQLTYRQIAARMGWGHPTSAMRAVESALDRQPFEDAARVRQVEAEKLDILEQAGWRHLRMDHLTVSHGKVIYVDDIALIDEGAKLAGIDRVLKVMERRAKLLGLDAPTRHILEVLDADTVDSAILKLEAEMKALAGVAPVPAV